MKPAGPAVVVEVRTGMSPEALGRVFASIAAAGDGDVVCLVHGADLTVVDALARVELLCQRLGLRLRVRATLPAALAGLLELAGLRDVLSAGLEVLGEPEPGEQ